jgi:hypothetical protein
MPISTARSRPSRLRCCWRTRSTGCHRCPRSDAAPRGAECVGAFFGGPEGTWSARIAGAADVRPEIEYDTIVAGAKRLDAIAALWLARHDARLAQQAT